LIDQLRLALVQQARSGAATTYGALARRIGLQPPHTIHRLTQALERLMEEDAAAGRPMLAALVAGKAWAGLPGPGFFAKAQMLGLFSGDPEGPEARDFYEGETQRAVVFYSVSRN
jgi:hypothetical protein